MEGRGSELSGKGKWVLKYLVFGGLATGNRLHKRGVIKYDVCPLCGEEGDDEYHRLWRCRVADGVEGCRMEE